MLAAYTLYISVYWRCIFNFCSALELPCTLPFFHFSSSRKTVLSVFLSKDTQTREEHLIFGQRHHLITQLYLFFNPRNIVYKRPFFFSFSFQFIFYRLVKKENGPNWEKERSTAVFFFFIESHPELTLNLLLSDINWFVDIFLRCNIRLAVCVAFQLGGTFF